MVVQHIIKAFAAYASCVAVAVAISGPALADAPQGAAPTPPTVLKWSTPSRKADTPASTIILRGDQLFVDVAYRDINMDGAQIQSAMLACQISTQNIERIEAQLQEKQPELTIDGKGETPMVCTFHDVTPAYFNGQMVGQCCLQVDFDSLDHAKRVAAQLQNALGLHEPTERSKARQ